MSAAAGLARLAPDKRDPLRASISGVGEMTRDPADRGAREIVVGLGGSATNDGGAGLARAWFPFSRSSGPKLIEFPAKLLDLARIIPPNELRLPPTPQPPTCLLRCSATSARREFSPYKKGALPPQLEILEQTLTNSPRHRALVRQR